MESNANTSNTFQNNNLQRTLPPPLPETMFPQASNIFKDSEKKGVVLVLIFFVS
jgi:hypothetical protein